jgi:hypothetical protein
MVLNSPIVTCISLGSDYDLNQAARVCVPAFAFRLTIGNAPDRVLWMAAIGRVGECIDSRSKRAAGSIDGEGALGAN